MEQLKNKHVFIVDWPDRSGKWTFIKCLNKYFEDNNINKSNFKDDIWWKYLSKIENYEWTTQNQIESCVFTQYDVFNHLSNENNKVIVDRGLYSVICYNELRLNWKKNKTNQEWTFILYDNDDVNDNTKEYYQRNYSNLLLIDSLFEKSNLLHVFMIPNIEEWKERCTTKREDVYDDYAKQNYECICKAYEDSSKNTKVDSLIIDFNVIWNEIPVFFQSNWERILIDLLSKNQFDLETEEWLESFFYNFIKIHLK